MTQTEYISVGKIAKPHGIHGALIFLMNMDLKEEGVIPTHFFIAKNGMYSPLFIEEMEFNKEDSGIIKFEEIKDRTQATPYSNHGLFLTAKDAETYFEEPEDDLDFLIGFTAYNNEHPIGEIIAFEEMPLQTLVVVQNGENEHLIPLVDDFILEINKKTKQIVFDLPEGLLAL